MRPKRQTRNVALHEFFQFRCSWQWVGAGIGAGFGVGVLATMALRQKQLRLPGLALAGFVGAGGVAYATMLEPRRPVLERVTLRLPSLPPALDGLRIGQFSDFHLGFPFTRANTQWAVRQMMDEKPDVIVLTGDFVSFRRAIPDLPALFGPLQAPLGVYAVPGNHDYWEGMDDIRASLEPAGVEFLINASRPLCWRGNEWWLAGIDDTWYGKADLAAALDGVPRGAFVVLLAHAPDIADTAAPWGVAVQLSGHTHGGHMHLPVLGKFCVPLHGLRYTSGLEQVGSMQLYVSRGLGGVPLRLNCRPEATILTLTRDT
ncbi:MAG: metallophosphoesterase [Chloroflexaceae bacterium]|nr:metallophosphoesterase [Chloroflexaceae bacterium]